MYKYRAYESSLTRNSRVKENGNMGRHTSDSPPPLIGDGKRRPIRDRLQSITSAMSWIKEELEGIKEQDKTLMTIFQKVQGDVKELNTFVSGHRSSSSLPGTPAAPQVQPQKNDTSLELDFDALDDDLSETSSHSSTPSPPLTGELQGSMESGTSSSNLDSNFHPNASRSRDNLTAATNHIQSRSEVTSQKQNGLIRSSDKDDTSDNQSGNISLSLGSLDLDFSMTSFGLGTISEGRSLMNIPMTSSTSSSSHSSGSGDSPAMSKGSGFVMQRSISQQPLQPPEVAEKGRQLSYQPKKEPPKTLPKPRRESYAHTNRQAPPPARKLSHQTPVIRQISEIGPPRLSPQQERKEMMKSTPALFPSPPRTRRNTDSLQRPSKVMAPLLPFHAQQELQEAARNMKKDSKKTNGVIPQMPQGSPILHRRPPPGVPSNSKQASPPLASRTSSSPKHISPTSSRHNPHMPPGITASVSMSRLSPSVSRAADKANISPNSSTDSGIQYSSEGENGEGVSSDSTTNTRMAPEVGKGGPEGAKDLKGNNEKKGSEALGDFSDLLSVIANMGGGDSWLS